MMLHSQSMLSLKCHCVRWAVWLLVLIFSKTHWGIIFFYYAITCLLPTNCCYLFHRTPPAGSVPHDFGKHELPLGFHSLKINFFVLVLIFSFVLLLNLFGFWTMSVEWDGIQWRGPSEILIRPFLQMTAWSGTEPSRFFNGLNADFCIRSHHYFSAWSWAP